MKSKEERIKEAEAYIQMLYAEGSVHSESGYYYKDVEQAIKIAAGEDHFVKPASGKIENSGEWHKIGNKLCDFLGICGCQRKLKSIVKVLVRIYEKRQKDEPFTGEEFLILAMLDARNLITHGVNCEYPIMIHMTKLGQEDFWEWIMKIKDSPYLEDN